MKRIGFTALLIFSVGMAPAFGANKPKQSSGDFCVWLGKMAEGIMTNRQAGTAPSEIRNAFKGDQFFELVASIVNKAYLLPRYATNEMQFREIQDFRNDIESDCYLGEVKKKALAK